MLNIWIHNFFRSNYVFSKPTTIWSGTFTSHVLQKGSMNQLLGFPDTYSQTMVSPTNVVGYSNSSIGLSKNICLTLQRQSSNPQPGWYLHSNFSYFLGLWILVVHIILQSSTTTFYDLGLVVCIQIHEDIVNCFYQVQVSEIVDSYS